MRKSHDDEGDKKTLSSAAREAAGVDGRKRRLLVAWSRKLGDDEQGPSDCGFMRIRGRRADVITFTIYPGEAHTESGDVVRISDLSATASWISDAPVTIDGSVTKGSRWKMAGEAFFIAWDTSLEERQPNQAGKLYYCDASFANIDVENAFEVAVSHDAD